MPDLRGNSVHTDLFTDRDMIHIMDFPDLIPPSMIHDNDLKILDNPTDQKCHTHMQPQITTISWDIKLALKLVYQLKGI
eukprot:13239682-Ditylum_brightwellii.AAC.2